MGKLLLTAMLRKSYHNIQHALATFQTHNALYRYLYISVYITKKQQEKGKEEEEREEVVEKWYEVRYSN